MKSIITLLFIVFSLSAKSQNPWKSLSYNKKLTWYYNTTETKRQGSIISSFIYDISTDKLHLEETKAQYKNLFLEDFENFSHSIKNIEFDCLANKYRHLSIRYFDTRDKLIKSMELDGNWNDMYPNSVTKKAFDILCEKIK